VNEILIAALSGLAGGYINHFSAVLSEDAAMLSGYIEDVEACAEAVEKYWLSKPNSLDEETISAALVRGRFSALAVFYGEAGKRLSMKRLREYQVLQVRFFKEGTGGDFESKGRGIDAERAIEAHKLSREIVNVLRLARREQLSPLYHLLSVFKRSVAYLSPSYTNRSSQNY